MVRRRPDVQQAYLNLLAADHDYASAVRSKYPRLNVRLSGQQRSNSFQTLFQDWAYTLAGNLLAPLIYGGQLTAEVERNLSVRDQLLALYGQSVLIAFKEVEDALVRQQLQKKQLGVLESQLDLAKKTNRQLRLEFLNGISPYLDILIALDQEQQLRRNVITERLEQLEARIGLYRALAGPIQTERETKDSETLN
ncbi:TolC family protein [Aegicerativicinus sediminis]